MALSQFSHTYGTTWTDGTTTLSGSITQTADSQRYFDQTITSTASQYNTAGSTAATGMILASGYSTWSAAVAASTIPVIPTKSVIGFFAIAQNVSTGGSVLLTLGAASAANTSITLQPNIPYIYVAPYNGATTVVNPLTGWASTTPGVTCLSAHDITAISVALLGGATTADVRIRFLLDSSVLSLVP